MKGGSKAVKSEDPEKEGWIFKGWYYIDEDGKETEWDFNTPVHRNLVLKAKWERPADTNSTEATKTKNIHDSGRKKKAKEKKQAAWKYREVRKAMAKTGEEFKWPWVLNGTGALLGIAFYLWRRSEKTR